MKSKTAEDLLGRSYDGGHVLMENAERAVEIAEQEAEERIRTELTRWHDPKEELPQEGKTVLIRVNGLELYKVGYYRPNRVHEYQWHTDDLSMPDSFVLGWREIHE